MPDDCGISAGVAAAAWAQPLKRSAQRHKHIRAGIPTWRSRRFFLRRSSLGIRAGLFIILKEDVHMRAVPFPVRKDYEKRFPRTFVVGQMIHTTRDGKFVMYTSGELNLANKDFTCRP